ncbi:hypothetical protein SAMN04489737_0521 [Arcanobacterium phocae]|uniref:Uncharacterized protein n=1 Tax=Arcanobacterium phocae TaxID=131112 RepID=A0A1H2LCA4_9ACTO|nr:hypothetical protein [Arcanobacterium phocae]SDU78559.1 hypothetical protein SAMN04489737_0521 [Arcanobacterium phocae]
MSESDRYGRFTVDNSRLLAWCMWWLRVECVRMRGLRESPVLTPKMLGVLYRPLRVVWDPIIKFLTFRFKYDSAEVDRLFAQGITAVEGGDQTTALSVVMSVEEKVASTNFDPSPYKDYLHRYRYLLMAGNARRQRAGLINLWFDMSHDWRERGSKGVYRFVDIAEFNIVLGFFSVVFIFIGLFFPIWLSSGWYRLVPPVYMGLMCAWSYYTGRHLNGIISISVQILGCVIGGLPLIYLTEVMSRGVIWSWSSGAIVGFVLANHYAYKICQYRANKYGPFGCLWARHITKNTYELLMVDSEGNKVWHYQITGWDKNIEPTLAIGLTTNLWGACRNKGWQSRPFEGWFMCYPALVVSRTEGMRLRSPVDWKEARAHTPGIDDEVVDEFFTNKLTIPLSPPTHLLEGGPQVLPRRSIFTLTDFTW